MGSAVFVDHLDNVHLQWLMVENLSPYLPLRIRKRLCIREKMGILVPTWGITLPGWLPWGLGRQS